MRKSAKLAALKEKQKQKEIHKQMFKDTARFMLDFTIIASISSLVLMLFDIQFGWDNVAITGIGFIFYKSKIQPAYMSIKGRPLRQ